MEKIQKVDALYILTSTKSGKFLVPHFIKRSKPVYVFHKRIGEICLGAQFSDKYGYLMTLDEAIELQKEIKFIIKQYMLSRKTKIIKIDLPLNCSIREKYFKK